jgi:SpoVK/Ycf46/Vps4 family AAA+-type ATPase
LARAIADYLNWPQLVVDQSYFVKTGMDNIQSQADKLFSMLSAAETIVVLLDEFDEMVRAREQAEDILSRFLTTAMLPKLAKINESRKIVFLVATNYIGNFDLAISRRGRFDLILQVMPPYLDAKLKNWPQVNDHLKQFGLKDNTHVTSILELLTFDEFETFVIEVLKAQNRDASIRIADDAVGRATLRSPAAPDGDGAFTWQAASTDQEKKIRLP